MSGEVHFNIKFIGNNEDEMKQINDIIESALEQKPETEWATSYSDLFNDDKIAGHHFDKRQINDTTIEINFGLYGSNGMCYDVAKFADEFTEKYSGKILITEQTESGVRNYTVFNNKLVEKK